MNLSALRRRGAFLFLLFFSSGGAPVFAYYSSAGERTKGILFCSLGLVGGVAAFFWGFFQLRTKRLMQDIPTSTLRSMAPGLVEVTGTAVDWNPFPGPLTRENCVYYQFSIEQWVSSGKNSRWETILRGDSKDKPFYLQDGTGTVMVAPTGSTIDIPDQYLHETGSFEEVSPHIEELMSQQGLSCKTFLGFEKKLRFTERHLKPSESVFVMATCQEMAGPPAGSPPEASTQVCLAKGQRSGEVFIVSDESQRDLESSYGWHAFAGIFGGLLLIAGCLFVLLGILGVA